jgi:hypothetical protein
LTAGEGSENIGAQAATTEVSAAVPTIAALPSFNYGVVVFGSFSLLSLVVCLAKGVVPIYAVETVVWGTLAWYCHGRELSKAANLALLVIAVSVGGLEGFSVGLSWSDTARLGEREKPPPNPFDEVYRSSTPAAQPSLPDELSRSHPSPPVTEPNTFSQALAQASASPSSCPTTMPAGVKATTLSAEDAKGFVGTEAHVEESGKTQDDWLNQLIPWVAELSFHNQTNYCVSLADVEITLRQGPQSYQELHTVSLDGILRPGQERMFESVKLRRRTKDGSNALSVAEWHITKVMGFPPAR